MSLPATVRNMLLVPPAWHGAWAFGPLLPHLGARGVRSEAFDLPGHGASPEDLTDLYGDAAALSARLDRMEEPTVLVGQSYGGMVITESGSHPAVEALVYVAAALPQEGESMSDAGSSGSPEDAGELMRHAERREGAAGSVLVLRGEGAAGALAGDCDLTTRRWLLEHLEPHTTASFKQPVRGLAWREKPTTYVVCTLDRTLPPERQRRMARHAGHVVELRSGHSPALSRPEELAAILAEAAGRG